MELAQADRQELWLVNLAKILEALLAQSIAKSLLYEKKKINQY